MGRCKVMANIPSVTKTQAMAVGHYDKDELETYIQAVICKIEKAAKEGLFFTRIEYGEIVDNPIYYDNYYDAMWIVNNMEAIAQNIANSILKYYQVIE